MGASYYANHLRRKTGSFSFIDAPWKIIIEGEDCYSGFLMYNEEGTIYFYAYAANFVGIHLYYKERIPKNKKDKALPFSIDLMHTELLAYLCNNTIPRLMQHNLGSSQKLNKGR